MPKKRLMSSIGLLEFREAFWNEEPYLEAYLIQTLPNGDEICIYRGDADCAIDATNDEILSAWTHPQ